MTQWPSRRFLIERRSHGAYHLRTLAAAGEGRGTLFYVHGLGESGLCFEPLTSDPRLADWHQIQPDLVGYGKSEWSREPEGLSDQADRLATLLDEVAEGPVVVVGHSMGGVIGTYLAERRPERVRAFVNVEGNISRGDCGYSGQAAPYELDAWLSRGFDRVLDRIYGDSGERTEVVRAYGASIQMADPRTFLLHSKELVEVSESESLARRQAAATPPSIYLHGVPRGTGSRSLELLAEAGVETRGIEGAGHWPFLDQHDAFVEQLLDFLDTDGTAGR